MADPIAPRNADERQFWERVVTAYIGGVATIQRSYTAEHVLKGARLVASEALDIRREVFAEGRKQEAAQWEADHG